MVYLCVNISKIKEKEKGAYEKEHTRAGDSRCVATWAVVCALLKYIGIASSDVHCCWVLVLVVVEVMMQLSLRKWWRWRWW